MSRKQIEYNEMMERKLAEERYAADAERTISALEAQVDALEGELRDIQDDDTVEAGD